MKAVYTPTWLVSGSDAWLTITGLSSSGWCPVTYFILSPDGYVIVQVLFLSSSSAGSSTTSACCLPFLLLSDKPQQKYNDNTED